MRCSRQPVALVLVTAVALTALVACGTTATAPAPKPIPAGGRFEGEWHTNWGAMKLSRRGDRLFGTYETRQGTIWGSVSGNLFSFNWKQMDGRRWGRGWLVLSDDGRRLDGTWGEETDDAGGGTWWAERKAHGHGVGGT